MIGDDFYLRSWESGDAAWYVSARDEEIFRWTTEKRDLTVEETEAAIRRLSSSPGVWCFAIVNSQSHELLGNIALTIDEKDARSAEIMYWLAARARGRGTASKAVKLLCDWAFERMGMERIWLKTLPGNLPSQRVAHNAGFHRVESQEPAMWYFERTL